MKSGRKESSSQEERFWKVRSQKYNNLKWVKDNSYLNSFVSAGNFKKTDLVLDVGTGTGIVAHAIAPIVKEVIGLDKSQDMLEHSNWQGNKYFIKRDIRVPTFYEGVFDKITARMVFHHILENTQKAMNECYRILKKGGKMILSEGVPPVPGVRQDYVKIFRLKEKRLTFLEDDLTRMMKKGGFKKITLHTHMMRNFSVRDWLNNSGLPKSRQKKIYDMHVNGSDVFRKAYNMKITKDDCLIDVKNVILVGEK
ncbi:class I SAM-dependent methyltransferase [Candidatus Woesearchaeota archaeon]|nr:class I SAM-dependent methyltransferase [Candidatus Woesearchaeota archaeon]